jgi:outer membrane immunogenic protein
MSRCLGWAFASIILIGSLSSAIAADMAVKAPPPPVVAVYNWTGFYAGVNLGGEWTSSGNGWRVDPNNAADVPGAIAARQTLTNNRINAFDAMGGVQAGYNWQTSNWVFGVEADWDLTGQNRSTLFQASLVPLFGTVTDGNNLTQGIGLDWLATVRGRVGFAANTALFYVTGGLAVGRVETFDSSHYAAGVTQTANVSTTRTGWTVGGGIEYAIGQNWSVKGEYLYADLGRVTTYSGLQPTFALAFFHDHSLTVNDFKFGVNYKWGGPVVAKY